MGQGWTAAISSCPATVLKKNGVPYELQHLDKFGSGAVFIPLTVGGAPPSG